jgi:hypothetical protein
MAETDSYVLKIIEIIGPNNQLVTFLHNTPDENNAQMIMKEGFKFHSHLDYTTDVVSAKDEVTITYFNLVRGAYGNFTLIIQIDKKLIEKYSNLLYDHHYHFSEVLTIGNPQQTEDGEWIYNLAPIFIKGYFDSKSGKFTANPLFDPSNDLPVFMSNLNKFTPGKKT